MRRTGFLMGMITGAALGALIVAMTQDDMRRPVMHSMGRMGSRMGDRMRRMWHRGGDMMEQLIPEDVH